MCDVDINCLHELLVKSFQNDDQSVQMATNNLAEMFNDINSVFFLLDIFNYENQENIKLASSIYFKQQLIKHWKGLTNEQINLIKPQLIDIIVNMTTITQVTYIVESINYIIDEQQWPDFGENIFSIQLTEEAALNVYSEITCLLSKEFITIHHEYLNRIVEYGFDSLSIVNRIKSLNIISTATRIIHELSLFCLHYNSIIELVNCVRTEANPDAFLKEIWKFMFVFLKLFTIDQIDKTNDFFNIIVDICNLPILEPCTKYHCVFSAKYLVKHNLLGLDQIFALIQISFDLTLQEAMRKEGLPTIYDDIIIASVGIVDPECLVDSVLEQIIKPSLQVDKVPYIVSGLLFFSFLIDSCPLHAGVESDELINLITTYFYVDDIEIHLAVNVLVDTMTQTRLFFDIFPTKLAPIFLPYIFNENNSLFMEDYHVFSKICNMANASANKIPSLLYEMWENRSKYFNINKNIFISCMTLAIELANDIPHDFIKAICNFVVEIISDESVEIETIGGTFALLGSLYSNNTEINDHISQIVKYLFKLTDNYGAEEFSTYVADFFINFFINFKKESVKYILPFINWLKFYIDHAIEQIPDNPSRETCYYALICGFALRYKCFDEETIISYVNILFPISITILSQVKDQELIEIFLQTLKRITHYLNPKEEYEVFSMIKSKLHKSTHSDYETYQIFILLNRLTKCSNDANNRAEFLTFCYEYFITCLEQTSDILLVIHASKLLEHIILIDYPQMPSLITYIINKMITQNWDSTVRTNYIGCFSRGIELHSMSTESIQIIYNNFEQMIDVRDSLYLLHDTAYLLNITLWTYPELTSEVNKSIPFLLEQVRKNADNDIPVKTMDNVASLLLKYDDEMNIFDIEHLTLAFEHFIPVDYSEVENMIQCFMSIYSKHNLECDVNLSSCFAVVLVKYITYCDINEKEDDLELKAGAYNNLLNIIQKSSQAIHLAQQYLSEQFNASFLHTFNQILDEIPQ